MNNSVEVEQKALSLNEIRTRCAQFVLDWQDSTGDERQEAQSFVRDLLMAYGISETKAALYEKRVQRSSTGNQGYIDALIPGLLLVEMKSAGKNLGLAEIQAMDYIQHLPDSESPRYILTSDFKHFRLLDLHAPEGKDLTKFSLQELPKQAEALGFLAGYTTRSFGNQAQEEASIKAAKIMANLYEALEGSGYSDHEASVFLVRTLFALYADDSGVWSRDSFTAFIESRTAPDGSDLGPQLNMLFQVMNQPLDKRSTNLDELLAKFPYVNGGVFAEPLTMPSFDKKMRDQLLTACAFDWSDISPAIFGSLFQAVKSAEARRELGEHYTTETNILKTIEPLFLDELRDKFKTASNDVNALKGLRKEIAEIRIFDPACGCGNFLVVSYRELRQLELEILLRLQELGDTTSIPTLYFERSDLAVQLDHIYGIEIEEWPARIAQTALLLAEHQANMAMEKALGKAPTILPLETVNGIHIGNSLRLDWMSVVAPSEHVRIVGNPPFIGHQTKTKEQADDLKHVWGVAYDGYLDYVTGWFKKASDFFDGRSGRFAFVSTNSIAQGVPVEPLFKPLFSSGWRIRFAHQTFPWESEAPGSAAVHCVITGFDKESKATPVLFTYATPKSEPVAQEVEVINSYLVDSPNVFVGKRTSLLSSQLPEANFGTMAIDGGNLIVERDQIEEFLKDPVASIYLRQYVGSRELIQGLDRWCLWLEDVDPVDLQKSQLLRDRVQQCRVFREGQTETGDAFKYRATPHLFRSNSKRPKVPYLCIPSVVSENRPFFTVAHLSEDVIASNLVFTAEDPDGFAFAVASSSIFITWQKAIGGRLKSDLRFSNTIVWNNLPLPEVSAELRSQIIDAGKGVLTARALHPERSLADHYNPLAMAPELLKAHAALDKFVDKAFGATRILKSNEERQAVLFERYQELTA